jgi:hypothetical protein
LPGRETNFEISQGLIHPIHPGFNAKKHGRTGLFRGVLASAPPNLTDLTSSSPSILSATWQNFAIVDLPQEISLIEGQKDQKAAVAGWSMGSCLTNLSLLGMIHHDYSDYSIH